MKAGLRKYAAPPYSDNYNMETGIKFDSEKPDYSLIPPYALNELVKVLTYGKNKYSRDNWRHLEDAHNRYFAAAQRHLWLIKCGETHDAESGMHHAMHAAACLFFLYEIELSEKN